MSDQTLSRAAAEALLDGRPGPERLRYVLSVAAGPGEPDELRGEEAARAAFLAAADTSAAPGTVVDPVRVRGRTLSRIVAAKAIAAVALTVGAGSVAVAATTNSFREGFGESTGQHSGPAPADTHRTLVVDRASGSASRDAAELTPRTADSPEPDGSGDRSGSCGDGAAPDCTAPPAIPPAASPSRPTSASVGSAAASGAPAVPKPAPPGHASAAPDTTKNHPPNGNTKSKAPKPQPPGKVKKTQSAAKEAGIGKADED